MTPPKLSLELDTESNGSLTTWQKIKRLTALITAIAALVAGVTTFLSRNSKQDKMQESVYNVLTKRFEGFAIDNAVLKAEIKFLKEQNKEIKADVRSFHRNHPTIRNRPEHKPMGASIREKIEKESVILSSDATMVTLSSDSEPEPLPAKIEYKGIARLPVFENIQQMVQQKGEAVKKHEIKK